jgi:hypothetical protein
MSARKLSHAFLTLSSAFVLWPTLPATFPAAQVHQAQTQMSKIASRTAAGRIKFDVRPDAASVLISVPDSVQRDFQRSGRPKSDVN